MPNIKSAKKRVMISSIRRLRNKSDISALRNCVKKLEQALASDTDQAKELLPVVFKELDQAAAKGLIHKNAAARKKSRLMQRLNRRIAVNS